MILKALAYSGKGDFELVNISKPKLDGSCGAIIKLLGSGLCGSDLVKVKRNLVTEGTVLGHEVVGIVEEINTNKTTRFKVGDRVAVAHHVPCFSCRYCLHGSYSMCKTFKKSNLEPGGFAEYIYLSENHLEYNTVLVPPETSDMQASSMEPLGCILRAVDRANIKSKSNVLIMGLGYIGLMFIQVLKHYDSYVMGCDLLDDRIEQGNKMGADYCFNVADLRTNELLIKEKIGFEGVDVVILASGSNSSIDYALNLLRDGGKIVVFASIGDDNKGFSNNQVYYRELSVIGAYSASPDYLNEAMDFISCGKIKIEELTSTFSFEDANIAIDKIISHELMKVYLKI